MKKLYLYLNIPRLLPFFFCYLFSSNKEIIIGDLEAFRNYGVNRKSYNKVFSIFAFLLFIKEYRNIFLFRQNIFFKKFLAIFCKPLSSLYIVTSKNQIGKGLLIVHGFSTIINAEKIGDYCSIYQQVTIGYGKGGKPTIGDNVTIYAGAIIIGNITIGNNCIIGAGAIINKSIPDNSTCVGSSFRIIKSE